MDEVDTQRTRPDPSKQDSGLSYKFQRLREKLRQAIASGELNGKLPGERALARRFHVNAKTLSKALTDLAAEGLLDRSIGRGTYVKGQGPSGPAKKRWLLVCDAQQLACHILELIRQEHPDLDTTTDVTSLRPSYLNQFSAVINFAENTPEDFLRELVVRNIAVVVVGREPRIYSTHAVLFDFPLAASQIGRDLVLAGHRRLAAVETQGSREVVDALSRTASRYAPDANVESCGLSELQTKIESGVTAIVCQNMLWANQVKEQLDKLGIAVPQRVSLVALGPNDDQTVTGYYLPLAEKARAIVRLVADAQAARPTTLWLAGQYVDRGTLSPRVAAEYRQYGAASA